MLFAAHNGGLELRKRGSRVSLRGAFPYGSAAVLSDGGRTGRPMKEIIGPRAFAYRVDDPAEEIHLLIGHSFDRPLARKLDGSLKLKDTDEALAFEAELAEELMAAPYVQDFLAGVSAGLIAGLSPGFRIPPKRAVEKAETVAEEDPAEGQAIIRTIHQALLYELSAVTRPAYQEAQIAMRSWQPERPVAAPQNPRFRWRL